MIGPGRLTVRLRLLEAACLCLCASFSYAQSTTQSFGPPLPPPTQESSTITELAEADNGVVQKDETAGGVDLNGQVTPVTTKQPTIKTGQARTARPLGLPTDRSTLTSNLQKPAKGDDTAWIWKTSLALGGVVMLIVLFAGVLRFTARFRGGIAGDLGPGGRAPSGLLEVLGRYPVGRGVQLVLLRVDRRVLLLSQSAGGKLSGQRFAVLTEITDPDEVASILVKARDEEGASMSKRFQALLGQYEQNGLPDEPAVDRRVDRSMTQNEHGDRVELWNDQSVDIPIVEVPPRGMGGPGGRGGRGGRGRLSRPSGSIGA